MCWLTCWHLASGFIFLFVLVIISSLTHFLLCGRLILVLIYQNLSMSLFMTPRNYFKFQQHFLIFIFALGTAWKSSQVFLERRIFSQYPKDIDGTSHDPVVVQSPSCVQLFVTPWMEAHQTSFSLTIPQSLPKFMFIAFVMPSKHLILWCPLCLLLLIFPSIRDLSNKLSVRIRWPKYWNFSSSISPSSEYSGLISLKMDCFDLLTAKWTFSFL